MKYLTVFPEARLQHIVRFYWILESEDGYTHHSLADMCPELLFHYNGRFNEILGDGSATPSFTAGIHGQSAQVSRFSIHNGFGMIGVYLYPQAIPLVFGIPAAEVTNQMPDLQSLLKSEAVALEESIFNAAGNSERIQLIEQFLLRRLAVTEKPEPPVFKAIAGIINAHGQHSIADLAATHYISERQFQRQFRHYTGFTPKLFSRIARFHGAMKRYGDKNISLTNLALECGYYDQAHFIHDFSRFSGQHPRIYFSGKSGATDWME
ncbi:transcriptional regulator, AraC family [Chitinophaga jiangningensis]|uniref:Transcriptional regulator, AraC family n=1 Tax=Chitinophaga jiangningensis TaxID=1419482 RepID=A0A1M6Y3M1_9BACT|nr:DUF6597 domain-containing transcriptional factor [Chitinophaga jiangningensis]SHL12837.1 transcriptional regulator, AraC family [Chitinophaga jiangningensis]